MLTKLTVTLDFSNVTYRLELFIFIFKLHQISILRELQTCTVPLFALSASVILHYSSHGDCETLKPLSLCFAAQQRDPLVTNVYEPAR